MRIYVYADESGVFDNSKGQNEYFAYGGIVVSAEAKKALERRYKALESTLRSEDDSLSDDPELKAAHMSPKQRRRLYGLLTSECQCRPFAAAVHISDVYEQIMLSKRDKQRFLDYALKRGIRVAVERIRRNGIGIDSMSVIVDEHSTATSGIYSFEESMDEEFRRGVYTCDFRSFKEPVFGPSFPKIRVSYLDSKRVPLIRAADITANYCWHVMNDHGPGSEALARFRRNASFIELP